MRQREIKGVVFRGAVPVLLYQVIADTTPDTKGTVSHMQLTAIKRADAQVQDRVQLCTQAAKHAPSDQHTYYNVLMHYQPVQPTD